nr:hypothetical protein [uncultured Sphingomonas sp.]
MSLRQRVLSALYNGVSQQPPIMRSSDQTEYELNTWAVISDGVGKRPPTEVVKHLGVISDDAFIHHINRDVGERYIVVADGATLKVFDHETGDPKVVNAPGGLGYLASGDFRAMSVADYTFIVNANVKVELDGEGTDTIPDPNYYRWVNPDPKEMGGFVGALLNQVKGSDSQYQPNPVNGGLLGKVASIEKLPQDAPDGAYYMVVGSTETGFTSFYVRRNGGVWDETVGPNQRNQIKSTTMPHALVREADGTFTFAPFSWAPRRTGDIQTNPGPTFINRTIRDVFFYQNRLGFLSDENAIVSEAGGFGNFWRTTVMDYIDSDVIDMAISTTNVAILNHAVPFNDGIFVMADQTQFSLTNGEDGMTPTSVAFDPVMNYEVNTRVRPVTIGSEAYFCGDQNGSSIVWEYTRMDGNEATAAAEITAHCPSYLPAGLRKLVSAPNLKALFAITGSSKVYAYQFYWNGNEKLMSAWREWDFGGTVIGGEYIGGYLYLLIRRGTEGVFLERVHLEPKAKPAEQNIQVFLDRRVAITGTYNSSTDRTTFNLPYEADTTKFRLVRGKTHPTRPGSLINPAQYIWTGNKTVTVQGNETQPATGGEKYTLRLTFSRQFPQDYQGRPVTTGRLQLRTFTLYYTGTAFFRTEVSPYGAAAAPDVESVVPAKIADFTGKIVGEDDLRLNTPAFHTGSYSFQVYGDASQATVSISNDTHVASTFVSAEWEGFYWNRTQG